MVEQITGFSARGVLWYQGESDELHADIYHILFENLIRCWRDAWKDDLSFLFVQLAPYGKLLGGGQIAYPLLRKKQEWVSDHVPGAYMVSIMDVGEKKDIHPKQKRPVGERLALLARGKIYGEDIEYEAPEFCRASVTAGAIELSFLHTADGLHIEGKKPTALVLWINDVKEKHWSTTVVDDKLIIARKNITKHSRIRIDFAKTGYCKVNLYNRIGLPAKPFTWNSDRIPGDSIK